uniref:Transposase Tc1-like domain-containing protein n=1 Tax=Esox lucius TaxID=8010 RepID=A0A3P8X9Q4_ESOLU
MDGSRQLDVHKKLGKCYKGISKALGFQRTTVTANISKWKKPGMVVNLPRSGRPTKSPSKAQQRFIQEVKKPGKHVRNYSHLYTLMTPKLPGIVKKVNFGRHGSWYVWCIANTVFHNKNIIPTVKHGGGSVMVWGCFATSGPGRLKTLKDNVQSSFCDLKLKHNSFMQPCNDPKHKGKSILEYKKIV